ncbi:hypothetical protein H8356DRAFT_1376374 [Neocallimastix lanati (nom. inval.)]|nr:hypothetical protein H8356DRAFT_1376374 [Neocallimastix sp. JGI-2020a]
MNRIFSPAERVDPDQCVFQGRVELKSESCYYTNTGGDITIENFNGHPNARYYDIDYKNNRALTEFGYLDIRLETNKYKEIYLSHDIYDNTNKKTGEKYYLKDVFDEAIDFLHINSQETVIIQLKDDNLSLNSSYTYYDVNGDLHRVDIEGFESYEEIYEEIAKLSIKNTSIKYNQEYYKYFYQENDIFPKLKDVRGKIILYTRGDFRYNGTTVGKKLNIPNMGSCTQSAFNPTNIISADRDKIGNAEQQISKDSASKELCFPRISLTGDNKILVQDDYNLPVFEKWVVVSEILNNELPSVEEDGNTLHIYGEKHAITTSFYNNDNILIINFMNIACYLDICSIKSYSEDINNNLDKNISEQTKIHNNWIILGFPTNDLIRKIHDSSEIKLEKKMNYKTISFKLVII